MKAALTSRFLKRKKIECDALKSEIEALQRETELDADAAKTLFN